MAEDDDEGSLRGEFESGHWEWSETIEGLLFVSDLPPQMMENVILGKKALTGAIEFRDDIDVIEQIRFRRRYQRKVKLGQPEVITLQDVKDIALYTAPVAILSPMLINLLHLPTTERFLRALIFCCQYYLQISEEMINRTLECETKVRTPFCDVIENEFRENICDLRVLVAKEYCTLLMGGSETKKFHHMGPQKKLRSLSDKDSRLIETFVRMCVQIVWLALGRKCFNQIELEVNRLVKSDTFNTVEHTLKTNYIAKMSKEERNVLFGPCLRYNKKLTTRSPLLHEVFCHRPMDYRLTGLGVIKYDELSPRLKHMERVISLPEEKFSNFKIVCGILGMRRGDFDTTLRPLSVAVAGGGRSSGTSVQQSNMSGGRSCQTKSEKSCPVVMKIYPDIILPPKYDDIDDHFPEHFPDKSETIAPCNEVQRKRWQARLVRLLNPTTVRKSN